MEPVFYVSGRGKDNNQDMMEYLKEHFPEADNIKSVYGFLQKMPLYGGRVWRQQDLTEQDLNTLYANGIGLELPLTGQHWNNLDYHNMSSFLEEHHREGNIITCYDRRLRDLIVQDFPLYKTKLSVTSGIRDVKSIGEMTELFDYVVLHPKYNYDFEYLKSLPNKEQLILFGSCGCIANCSGSNSCYTEISKKNYYGVEIGNICYKQRANMTHINSFTKYDINPYLGLGFNKFKLNRENKDSIKKAF